MANCASPITNLASFQVLLNGVALDSSLVMYAGVTPGFAGLYQINFQLPANVSANPEIQLQIGTQKSIGNVNLEVE